MPWNWWRRVRGIWQSWSGRWNGSWTPFGAGKRRAEHKKSALRKSFFQRADFYLSVAVVWSKMFGRNEVQRKMDKKVRKNRCFLSKTAVLMVDDTGLEPVTSRTSSGCSTSWANRPNSMDYYICRWVECQVLFLDFRRKIWKREMRKFPNFSWKKQKDVLHWRHRSWYLWGGFLC